MLVNSLQETRSTLIEEINAERVGINNTINQFKADFTSFLNDTSEELKGGSDEARHALADYGNSFVSFFHQQIDMLQYYLLQLAQSSFEIDPEGMFATTYIPFANIAIKQIESDIASFGQDILNTYTTSAETAISNAETNIIA